MTHAADDFVGACELHATDRIATLLAGGFDANAPIRGLRPVQWLTTMYTRSERFPACLRLLLDRGASLDDPVTAPVLLDDAPAVTALLRADPALRAHRTTMVSAFTPLVGASLLHVAAEFQCTRALAALLLAGVEVDARAATDEHGLGGHTALFHTVNSNADRAAPAMQMLLAAGASTDVRLAGLVWGRTFEWETVLFDLTPIAYAQCGLLPQMHRDQRQIRDTVQALLRAAGRPLPPLGNVPNRYLAK